MYLMVFNEKKEFSQRARCLRPELNVRNARWDNSPIEADRFQKSKTKVGDLNSSADFAGILAHFPKCVK